MRQIFVAVFFGLLFFIVSCQTGDKGKSKNPSNIVLDFGTNGSYDLSQYIFPIQNQINNYRDKQYKTSNRNREYSRSDENETFYSIRYEKVGTLTEEYKRDILNKKYETSQDRVKVTHIVINKIMELVRYADENEYIIKNESRITVDGRSGTDSLICKLDDFINQKEVLDKVYKDVLKFTCDIEDISRGTFNGSQFETRKIGTRTIFYAKNTGIIHSTSDICDTTKLNDLEKTTCEKIVTELTTIN